MACETVQQLRRCPRMVRVMGTKAAGEAAANAAAAWAAVGMGAAADAMKPLPKRRAAEGDWGPAQ
eukprot:3825445-Rhodomonas_salina.2